MDPRARQTTTMAARATVKWKGLSVRTGVVAAVVLLALATAPSARVDAQALAAAAAAAPTDDAERIAAAALDATPVATLDTGTSDDDYVDEEFPEPEDKSTPTNTEPPTPTEAPPTTTTAPTPPEKPTKPPTPPTTTTESESPTPTISVVVNDAASNHATHLRGVPNGVSPVLLVGLAVLCVGFLAVWSHRRRADGGADAAEGGAGGAGRSSAMSGMATTSSRDKSGAEGKKVQYSRIDSRAEEEELLDDEFGGRSGSWDDWENSNPSQRITIHSGAEEGRQADEEEEEEEHEEMRAKLTKGLSSSSSFSSVRPQSPPPFRGHSTMSTAGVKLSSPPLSASGGGGGGGAAAHHDRLLERLHADGAPPSKPTSVASNSSSNESFEVVVSPPAAAMSLDLLSGSLSPPKSQPSAAAHDATGVEDDLFSQFGMVPTFKKGVQQTPSPAYPPPSFSAYAVPASAAAALNPFAASPPPSTSSLFAADLDDMGVANDEAANEWGEEDDDWVQGI